MDWDQLQSREDLERAHMLSFSRPVLLYKHSTRCHICTMALGRIERGWSGEDAEKLTPFFLDVLKHRELSEEIENRYGVTHQSPQALVVRNGECVYNESHSAIIYEEIMAAADGGPST